MKLGIMQPYFVPYIGYWQLINATDKFVVYDDVNFIKSGWINRNKILMNGEAKMINLRMRGASSNKLINEIEILNDGIYKSKLLKTIEQCYRKAPYYLDIYPLIKEIIYFEENNLSLYLTNSIKRIAEYLGLKTLFILSSEIDKDNSLKGQDKVIDICRILSASEYINSVGGMDLYSEEFFDSNKINLKFLKTEMIEYKQYDYVFIPNLSILDIMMFNSKLEIKELLNSFLLI